MKGVLQYDQKEYGEAKKQLTNCLKVRGLGYLFGDQFLEEKFGNEPHEKMIISQLNCYVVCKALGQEEEAELYLAGAKLVRRKLL